MVYIQSRPVLSTIELLSSSDGLVLSPVTNARR